MSGPVAELLYSGRSGEGSRLASEQMALHESIGDPTLTIGLALAAFANWQDAGEFGEILRWSQTVIDLAPVIPPRAPASVLDHRWRSRWQFAASLGGGWAVPGGGRTSTTPSRWSDTATRQRSPFVVAWTYGLGIAHGVLRADDSTVRAIEEAVRTARRAGNDVALSVAEYTLGVALLSRDTAADRHRGLELMVQARDIWLRKQIALQMVPVVAVWAARERAGGGDRDADIAVMRQAVDDLRQAGRLGYGVWGTGLLVEALLERRAEGDLAEAQQAIDWLANLPADEGSGVCESTLLRLRALLARARDDDVVYRDLVGRYRAMAESLGFEGHIAWAKAMIEGGE